MQPSPSGNYRGLSARRTRSFRPDPVAALVMEMIPHDKPGELTSVRYSELEFDIDIDEDFFSLRALRSRGR